MKWIDEKIDEYGSKFYPTVGYNRYHEEAEWICTALKEAHQRGLEEERKRVLEWVNTPTNKVGVDQHGRCWIDPDDLINFINKV